MIAIIDIEENHFNITSNIVDDSMDKFLKKLSCTTNKYRRLKMAKGLKVRFIYSRALVEY